MAFIQMADFRAQAEPAQQPPPRQAQNDLLFQAQLRPAAIEFAGDAAVCGRIRRVIGIQQVEPRPAYLHLPGANPELESGKGDRQSHPFSIRFSQGSNGQLSRVVEWIERLLRAAGVNLLAKVALLVKQSHGHDGNGQIAGRFQLISRYVAQTTGVDRQTLAQHVLHAEVRRQFQLGFRMRFLKPCWGLDLLALLPQEFFHPAPERRVGRDDLELFLRYGLQYNPGVLRKFPELRIQLSPQLIRRTVPRPAQVKC